MTYQCLPVWTVPAPTHETMDGVMIAARRSHSQANMNRQADEAVRAAIRQGRLLGAVDDINEGVLTAALFAVMRS